MVFPFHRFSNGFCITFESVLQSFRVPLNQRLVLAAICSALFVNIFRDSDGRRIIVDSVEN